MSGLPDMIFLTCRPRTTTIEGKTSQEFGLSWACGHGQHALDEHDRDTVHALIA